MHFESYQIPVSFQSYTDQFENDPKLAISRLRSRIEKRNPGAVGYLLLAWLCHRNNDRHNALEAALTARRLAPGSPFLQRLPYFIQHPKAFDAWQPEAATGERKQNESLQDESHPIKDLDQLITRLSSIGSTKLDSNAPVTDLEDLSDQSTSVDDIVTETLAVIHEKQNNYPEAIRTYERLQQLIPEKSNTYKGEIERLKKLQDKSHRKK